MVSTHSWIIDGDAPFDALSAVLEYLWADELRSFRESPEPGHLFVRLVEIANWLNNSDWTPRDYLVAWENVPSDGWKASALYMLPTVGRRGRE